jgi:hypothetical protein
LRVIKIGKNAYEKGIDNPNNLSNNVTRYHNPEGESKMRILLFIAVLAAVLSPVGTQAAFAQSQSNCPPGFMLHSVSDMDHMMDGHMMVGVYDLNGDGYICARHVATDESIHVHTDNNFPLQ